MPDLPVIVSGVGRCGTSMLMAMFEAGGFPVLGEPPLYDQPMKRFVSIRDCLDEISTHWYEPTEGAATKMLFPFLQNLKTERAYRFIWLVRDPLQQAASQAKFAFANGGPAAEREDLRRLARNNMGLAIEGLKIHEKFADGSMMYSRRFEWCLGQPEQLARDLASYTEADLDLDAMVAVVRKRSGDCSTDLEFV